MTKLDLVLARLRQLPPDRQEAIADEIEFKLDNEETETLLTPEQWAEVDQALAANDEPSSSHQDVFARLRAQRRAAE
jgi:hypothetical protein